jgi:hypothetical protein
MASVLGTSAGSYRLQEIVSHDALGVVHRAEDERTGRQSLVRFLPQLARDPDAMRRFRIELPAIAALDHPGIVRVEAWGESDGVPYVVTGLVAAERLSDVLAGGRRLDRRFAVHVLRSTAAALDHAHRSGVVHGSVGPAALLVAADGAVRLSDFGLALVANAAPSPGGAGPAADVHDLAATAHELLAGPLPPAVDAVLQRGLADGPQDRWESCGAMVEALEAALSGRQVTVAEPAPAPRAPLRRWIGLAGGALLLLVLVVTLAVHLLRPGPALALSQASAHAGDTVVVTGRNLPAGQPGTVVIKGRPAPAAAFTADGGGTFSVQVTIPQDVGAGDVTVEACWGGSCPVSQVLHVLSAPTPLPTAPPTQAVIQVTPTPRAVAPSISLNRLALHRGETVRIQGRGFDPLQQYEVVLDQGGRQWVLQRPASPDENGAFTDSVQVPGEVRRGVATVVACIYSSGSTAACASQPVLVTS